MSTPSNSFDPITLLSDSDRLQLSQKNIEQLRNNLNLKIWDYLTVKLSQDLTEQQLAEVLNSVGLQQRASILRKYILDFDQKVNRFLEEFKTDFITKQ